MKMPFTFWDIVGDDVNERSDLWLLGDDLWEFDNNNFWIIDDKAYVKKILDDLECDETSIREGFEGDDDIYALEFREITDENRNEIEKILTWKWWVLTRGDF